MRLADFQQFEQINDLVVTPITDIGPWVFGFDHLPVDSFVRDTVRVVTVCRSRIEELGDNMVDKERIRHRKRFPVLEYIAPVALISHNRLSLLVLHADGEQVPRTRRIAVPATECQRQILHLMPLLVGGNF